MSHTEPPPTLQDITNPVWKHWLYEAFKSLPNSHYKEDTFTPTLQDTSLSDSESQTYTTQTGSYTRLGNRVFFELDLKVNSLGTLGTSDGCYISLGTAPTIGTTSAVTVGDAESLNITAGYAVTAFADSSNNRIRLQLFDSTLGATGLSIAEFSAGGRVLIAGNYATTDD